MTYSAVFEDLAEQQLGQMAASVAAVSRPRDVFLLIGELGAGKTAFVKAFAAQLACQDPVSSPTYTLAHAYKSDAGLLLHIDCYRLSGPREFLDLGVEDQLDEARTLIEWGDRVSPLFPGALEVLIDPGADAGLRRVTLSSTDERWSWRLKHLHT